MEKFKKLKEIERKKEENEFDLGKRKKERKKEMNNVLFIFLALLQKDKIINQLIEEVKEIKKEKEREKNKFENVRKKERKNKNNNKQQA